MFKRMVLKRVLDEVGRLQNATKKRRGENEVDRNAKKWVNMLNGISHTQKQSANGPLLIRRNKHLHSAIIFKRK